MKIGEARFREWAPSTDPWSPWVKPSLFASILLPGTAAATMEPPHAGTGWARAQASETAIIVDLPGIESLHMGFALAAEGYRPVPLYNTSHGEPRPALNVMPLVDALSVELPSEVTSAITRGGSPAFLLDSERNRAGTKPEPETYDNRWIVFPQDFPSGNLLLSRGIKRVVVLQAHDASQPQEDLAHVLLRWQEAGIAILLHRNGSAVSPREIKVDRPSRFRALRYRILVMMGLQKSSAGGFGGVIPLPPSGSG